MADKSLTLQQNKERAAIALSAAIRAIGKGKNTPGPDPLDLPANQLPDLSLKKNFRIARGISDQNALRLRHSDRNMFEGCHLQSKVTALALHALEQARCEVLGIREYPGMVGNLDAELQNNLEKTPLTATPADNIPSILYMLARRDLGNQPVPESARNIVNKYMMRLGHNPGKNIMQDLAPHLGNQKDFLLAALKTLKKLGLDITPGEMTPEDQGKNEGQGNGEDAKSKSDKNKPSLSMEGDVDGDNNFDADIEAFAKMLEGSTKPSDRNSGKGAPASRSAPRKKSSGTKYKIFTTEFDEIVSARDLAKPSDLKLWYSKLATAVEKESQAIKMLANRLRRKLQAHEMTHLLPERDLEDGMLDTTRLTRIFTAPVNPLAYKAEDNYENQGTVVTLLLDNSGSMRGYSILKAAISAFVLARTLELCKVKVEILGFTTNGNGGGRSAAKWRAAGKPPNPGRLNEVRHIIYKSADEPWRRARENLGLMMDDHFLKENLDGEALNWAHERLLARPEKRKILIAISDGIPFDGPTINKNEYGDIILADHLREVITHIEQKSPVELSAIGIKHDVTQYYKKAIMIADTGDLSKTLILSLDSLFDGPAKKGRKPRSAPVLPSN